jgi:hypothetical protein
MRRLLLWGMASIALIVAIFLIYLFSTTEGMNLQSKDAFVKELENRGYSIEHTTKVAEDKWDFDVPRQTVATDRAIFSIYEFSSEEDAIKAASYISPSGSSIRKPKQSIFISWSGLPHYYCGGKLIVLYVGRSPKILYDMRNIMGKQTAGAKWYEVLLSNKGK